MGLGRVLAARVDRGADVDDQARHRRRPDLGPHTDRDRDARAHARPPERRPRDPRASGCRDRRWSKGWYGQPFGKPLARTREYVEIIRRVLAREAPLEFPGDHYQHPYTGPGSVGLGKPLKSITHPLRADIPIYLGAEGPKNVAMTAEIADGWLPLYYSPFRPEVYAESLAAAKPDFEIAALCNFIITDDIEGALLPSKASLGFYIGGMGAEGANFHKNLMARMGYESEANEIQRLFLEGKRDEAIAMVPSAFADEISLVGPPERIRERLQMWEDSAVTTLNVAVQDVDTMRQIAELVAAQRSERVRSRVGRERSCPH